VTRSREFDLQRRPCNIAAVTQRFCFSLTSRSTLQCVFHDHREVRHCRGTIFKVVCLRLSLCRGRPDSVSRGAGGTNG